YCLINEIDITQKVLLTSGRISSEMMAKTIKAKIPIVISRSAPTSYAVRLAEIYLITLIGFARAERFNIYTFPERIMSE
ncbi:formate dehydrogenase accessory sulfurtransferase FdhD, partial [bacterium]|nr:formate dehydrogenase accessory sulfurtransferase FdhD [bacterium]